MSNRTDDFSLIRYLPKNVAVVTFVLMSGTTGAVPPAVSDTCPNSSLMSEYCTSRPNLNDSPIEPSRPRPPASSALLSCASHVGLAAVSRQSPTEEAPTHDA